MIKRVKAGNATQKIDLWVRRVEEMFVAQYRALIWETLHELVVTTPQWSGHAAANWNIGIDQPDAKVHTYEFKLEAQRDQHLFLARQVGNDDAWNSVRARYADGEFLTGVKRRSRVFFTNPVLGDLNWGDRQVVEYLALYQNPSWHHKLRLVNQPYETAQEVIRRMDAQWRSRESGMDKKLGFGRISGYSFNAEFA